jgi:hypothetical protein
MPLRLIRESLRDPLAVMVGLAVAAVVTYFAIQWFLWTAATTIIIAGVAVRVLILSDRNASPPSVSD